MATDSVIVDTPILTKMKKLILFVALFTSIGLFAAKNVESVNHKVQPKETLFRISLMYNSTVNDILEANPGLTAKTLAAGAVVKVPKDTKMRDPEFVATFLGEKPVFISISQIATQVKTNRPLPAKTTTSQEAAPAEKKAEAIKSAVTETPVQASISAQAKEDENPFLTPSEARTGPIADEQPIKEEKIAEPASADNGQIEDENPFMSPRERSPKK
ncbi:MAG: hypothetical protein JWO03_829 [Bacteroidetes bacterium]|nr:hypothetical protein [Bacteroidota bacterium]